MEINRRNIPEYQYSPSLHDILYLYNLGIGESYILNKDKRVMISISDGEVVKTNTPFRIFLDSVKIQKIDNSISYKIMEIYMNIDVNEYLITDEFNSIAPELVY